MGRRMIDSGMWSNENFAELPWGARLLQIGIINHADDQGRLKANPLYLRSLIFPYDNVTSEQILEWLGLIESNDTIARYQVDSKEYMQLVKWWEYQSLSFATPSDYPKPEGWRDRIRYTGKQRTIYTCNWISSTGEPLPDTCDESGNPIPQGKAPVPTNSNGNQPHGQPHGQPHEPLNKLNRNEDKGKEEVRAPTYPSLEEIAAGAFEQSKQQMMDSRRRYIYADGYTAEMEGCLEMVVRIHKLQQALKVEAKVNECRQAEKMQAVTAKLWHMGHNTAEKVQALGKRWYADSDFGKKGSTPKGDQLVQFASEIQQGIAQPAKPTKPQSTFVSSALDPQTMAELEAINHARFMAERNRTH